MSASKPSLDIKAIKCLEEAYWKHRPFKDRGDSDIDKIYKAVGKALSEWEKLEQRLANLFLVLCSVPDNSANPVRRAFGAIDNGTLRRKVVIAAAEVHFGKFWEESPTTRKAFIRFIDAVAFAAKRRDDIAHGIPDGNKEGGVDYGAFLFPPYYNTGRTLPWLKGDGPLRFKRSAFRMTSDDIDYWRDRFAELKLQLKELQNLVARRGNRIPFMEAVTGDVSLQFQE